jgi:propionyl-CoA synthetase
LTEDIDVGSYEQTYRRSIDDPEGFWGEAARLIDWIRKPTQVLDISELPFVHWFPDGELNTCYNALDRHVEAGRGETLALIYDSPVTQTIRRYKYVELRDETARLAGALQALGVEKGDTVIIYMPMIPEAAMAMLACARIGAVHSVVFGGFAAPELAARIDDAKPKVVLSASCGIEPTRIVAYKPLLDEAIRLAAHKPRHSIIFQRPQATAVLHGTDQDWEETVVAASPVDCVPVKATDPLYILYTSGTTAGPKGVVRDNGGHAVALAWSMPNIYDVRPGDVYWAASDVGWVVGHSYIVYAPLLAGVTSVLYEGKPVGTPDPGAFWRVIAEHKVNTLFCAPTAFRVIKKEDPKGKYKQSYDTSCLRALFLAGERLDPTTYEWARDVLSVPVIDHWWQTETGWPIAALSLGIEAKAVKPGSPTHPVPGYDVVVVDESSNPVPAGVQGEIVVRQPLPPGTLTTLYNAEERFRDSYFTCHPGFYRTGDGGYFDEDGYIWVMGRIDDVINVAGHRLSTGAMEEVLAQHPAVAECAVIGVVNSVKGQVPMGLVVLKAGVEVDPQQLRSELILAVRENIGAVASFHDVEVVAKLPKTRSGKILRATMRAIADGREYTVPGTIEDATALEGITEVIAPKARTS